MNGWHWYWQVLCVTVWCFFVAGAIVFGWKRGRRRAERELRQERRDRELASGMMQMAVGDSAVQIVEAFVLDVKQRGITRIEKYPPANGSVHLNLWVQMAIKLVPVWVPEGMPSRVIHALVRAAAAFRVEDLQAESVKCVLCRAVARELNA